MGHLSQPQVDQNPDLLLFYGTASQALLLHFDVQEMVNSRAMRWRRMYVITEVQHSHSACQGRKGCLFKCNAAAHKYPMLCVSMCLGICSGFDVVW